MSDNFLHKYVLSNTSDHIFKWTHYLDIYEHHFTRFRDKPVTMLEIGVGFGGSVKMWKEFLGPQARIIGLDINPDCKQYESDGVKIVIGSQDDPVLLNNITALYPKIDIVLDDGSHQMKHVKSTFGHLYHKISPNGVYMIEDLHTAYWDEYGGGLRREGSFIEYTKELIDEINAVHTRGTVAATDFTSSTFSINVYDSIVAFEKRPQGRRGVISTSGMNHPHWGI
jgi:hypothetical protein